MRPALLLVPFLLAAVPASAQQGDDLATALGRCRDVVDNLQRLDCYDRLDPTAAAPAEAPRPGQWQVYDQTSAVDGSRSVLAALVSSPRAGMDEAPATLYFRCEEKVADVFLLPAFRPDGGDLVSYRIDDRPVQRDTWSVARDGAVVADNPLPFLRDLAAGRHLAIKLVGAAGTQEAVFDLGAIRPVIERIAQACNWKL